MAKKRKRGKPEGVVSKGELRAEFKRAWRICGHPKKNRKCWERILKKAWSDV